MTQEPDFYLCAKGENVDLSHPRTCWRRKRLRDEIRDDYVLVEIAPAVVGQRYGLGDKDITYLILASRHQGVTLFPVTEWPAHVYVFRILDEALFRQNIFDAHQVEMIAWGMICRSLSDVDDCTAKQSL